MKFIILSLFLFPSFVSQGLYSPFINYTLQYVNNISTVCGKLNLFPKLSGEYKMLLTHTRCIIVMNNM